MSARFQLRSKLRKMSVPFTALIVLGLGGCAVNPRNHFDEVKQTVFDRTGQQVIWNTGGYEDVEAQERVQSLLRQELSADQAVAISLLNNPELQAIYEDLGIAQADLVQAGLLKNPVISAEMRFPARPHYPVQVNVEDEFLDLLLMPLRKKIAEASFAQSKAKVISDVISHAAEVRREFYKLQGAQQLRDMRELVVAAAQANVDASRRLREAGNIRELDLSNDQGLLAQARVDLADSEAVVAEHREQLNMLMGVWGPDVNAWTVGPRLPEPLAEMSLVGLETLAISQRQELIASRNGLIAAGRNAGSADATAILSNVKVGGDLVRDADVKLTVGPTISAPLPLFDQGQAAVAKARAQFRQARDRYQAMAIRIRSQVRKAHYQMAVAREKAKYYKDFVIPLRHRILEQTQLQYNGMFVGVSVLLQAKQEEINAGAKYVEALRDYWVARSDLEEAVGGRLEGTPTTEAAPLAPSYPSMLRTPSSTRPGNDDTVPAPTAKHPHSH